MGNCHISKIFIANRGEIAFRIIRTASKMGISSVVPVTKDEEHTLPALAADEVHILKSSNLHDTYLAAEVMVQLALQYGADAIHPGYGFLSENAHFAELTQKNGLAWIGPSPAVIADMGNKLKARKIASNAGVSISKAKWGTQEEIMQAHVSLRFPLLIKAAAGGGGKAMKIAENADELKLMLTDAAREAKSYFGDESVYVEEYIKNPRHIEVQVLGDQHGNTIHLYERECSIQRRYQKIIEETPSPFVSDELRNRLVTDAIKLCRQTGYYNAGTVEFLVDENHQHYFLEMNTRLQVEHPVTEAITGIDLVEEQINIARGLPLPYSQSDIKIAGHAIEARLYAEDALNEFAPSPGKVEFVKWPEEKLVRTETFFEKPIEIQPHFDPMIAKIIGHASSRGLAISKLSSGLKQINVLGIKTTLPYLAQILNTEAFQQAQTTTHFVKYHQVALQQAILPNGTEKTRLLIMAYTLWLTRYRKDGDIWTKIGHKRWEGNHSLIMGNKNYNLKIKSVSENKIISWELEKLHMPDIEVMRFTKDNMAFITQEARYELSWFLKNDGSLLLGVDGYTYHVIPGYYLSDDTSNALTQNKESGITTAPIPGKIIKINTLPGSKIEKGAPLLILEAMKMENTISAPFSGVLKSLNIKEGDQVKAGQILAEIE